MRSQIRRTVALLVLGVLLMTGLGVGGAAARTSFRPRVGRAMGLIPIRGRVDPAQGSSIPVVYHGGAVMTGVTIHTIFWAPAGYRFDGSPGGGVLGYEALIQRFLADTAHDSGSTGNLYSVLGQYGTTGAPGSYSIAYSPGADSVDDTDPFPARSLQCPSPAGVETCITDQQLGAEIDHVVQTRDPGGYGLHDLWEIFLPPNVDECTSLGACGTNAFAGYHSETDLGHGELIYAVMIDPLIEGPATPGSDPQGNPEAEITLDTAAHETVEAITDPDGVGWMDPNGFEVGDKCEAGPQQGTPLGYAPDGSPYNQLINGHEYDLQEMWVNSGGLACVQSTTTTKNALPLPRVSLRQFSGAVSGSTGVARAGVLVHVGLLRASDLVAAAIGRTRGDGSWGPLLLRGPHGAVHGVGDDREAVLVEYGSGGPSPDLITTGAGGDPFTEAGWTTWLDLDTGFALSRHSIAVAPCGQTGVLGVSVNGVPVPPLIPRCSGSVDAASVPIAAPVTGASRVVFTSSDNRAVSELAPDGALVAMSVALGEPDSVSAVGSSHDPFEPTGLPACSLELRTQVASCSGLVPGERYRLRLQRRGRGAQRHARAGFDGVARFSAFGADSGSARGGDRLSLSGPSGRVLTVLHVARLRVAINGNESVVAGGHCQPGEFVGTPLISEPASAAIGAPGASGLGVVCPSDGRAAGLSDATLAQVDDRSGGSTETSVPLLTGTAPGQDAIVPSAFRVLAQTGVPGADGRVFSTGTRVSVAFFASRGGKHRRPVFRSASVAGGRGVRVSGLVPGVYRAVWVVRDANGDTRTVKTSFVVSG